MLLLNRGGAPECVVPANLKLEKDEGATPSELADKTELQGQIVAKSISSTDSIPRVVPGRQDCAGRHPGHGVGRVPARPEFSHHCGLEGLSGQISRRSPLRRSESRLVASSTSRMGKPTWRLIRPLSRAGQPNYGKLQAAKSALDSAMASAPSNPETEALATGINAETRRSQQQRPWAKSALYRDALAKQASGYSHLVAAETISQLTLGLDPKSPETASLSQACIQERTNLDHRLGRLCQQAIRQPAGRGL